MCCQSSSVCPDLKLLVLHCFGPSPAGLTTGGSLNVLPLPLDTGTFQKQKQFTQSLTLFVEESFHPHRKLQLLHMWVWNLSKVFYCGNTLSQFKSMTCYVVMISLCHVARMHEGTGRGKLGVCCLQNSKTTLAMRPSSEPASCLEIIMPSEQSCGSLQCTKYNIHNQMKGRNFSCVWTQLCQRPPRYKKQFLPTIHCFNQQPQNQSDIYYPIK